MSSPNFYAVIPASVRYDSGLCANAKLLYGEITAMCHSEGYCWADNAYFSELYHVSLFTISRWISQLEKNGHVVTELNKSEGNSRKIFIDKSAAAILTKSARPLDEKRKTLLTKNARPLDEKRKSIYENNTNNNTMNRESALEYFKLNYPMVYEQLLMQFKNQINDFVMFCQMFDATVEKEGLVYEQHVLSGRFKQYAIQWVRNQSGFDGKNKGVISIETDVDRIRKVSSAAI